MESTRNLKLIIVALLLLLGFSLIYNPFGITENMDNTRDICSDYSNDNVSTLKTGLISDLVERYRSKQLSYINERMYPMIHHSDPDLDPEHSDAHTIWFDLDTIKKFIYHIERNVQRNATTSENKLGLRLYYAAYPEQSEFKNNEDLKDLDNDPMTQKYGLKHTIVMIPTIYNSSIGDDVDFNPLDKDTYKGYISEKKNIKVNDEPILLAPYQAQGYEPMALSPSTRVVARNHGTLYPPGNIVGLGF